jgi:hypothetical protein
VADKEENAGNPIGSPKALVQTDIAAQVTAALTAATQRWQKELEASRAKSAAKIEAQLRDHQVWWTHTLKEQHAAQALLRKQLAELVPEQEQEQEQDPDPDPDPEQEQEQEQGPDTIGGELALVQTDVTAQVTAALTAATQRSQQDLAASMPKSAARLTDQQRDHQLWWTHTAKDQAAAHALLRTQLLPFKSILRQASECDRACGTLSYLCGSTQIESAEPTTTSEGKYALTEHNVQLEAKEQEHNGQLEAKEQEHNGQLEAKEQEHNVQLEAKEQEHNVQLEATEQEHNVQLEAPTTTSEGKYALAECDRACGTLSDLCGSTQTESAAPTTTSEGKYSLTEGNRACGTLSDLCGSWVGSTVGTAKALQSTPQADAVMSLVGSTVGTAKSLHSTPQDLPTELGR